MPNTLKFTIDKGNTVKGFEIEHPVTKAWVAGVLQSDGRYFATGIPEGTYSNLRGRLAGSNPAIIATWPGPVTVIGSTAPTNQKPSVSFSPATSAVPTVGVVKDYLALATDSDGSIALTELVQVTSVSDLTVLRVLASDNTSPYSLSWTPSTAGTVYLAARATDNSGDSSFSSVLTVTVQAANTGGTGSAPGSNDAFVLFMSGQSNTQGLGEATEVSYAPMLQNAPNVYQEFDNVQILLTGGGGFQKLKVGANNGGSTQRYPTLSPITGVGPEYGLACAWRALGYTQTLYIVKVALGGTPMSRWVKSANDLYPGLLAAKNTAFNVLAGKTIRVVGFYHNQGESDNTLSQSDYQAKLTQFYADTDADGITTAETRIVEHGVPTTYEDGNAHPANGVNAAKLAFASANSSRCTYLDPSYVAHEYDRLHYNLATQYYTGYVLLANAVLRAGLALPPDIPAAPPSLAFNSTNGSVTVTPPTSDWPLQEFLYSINGVTSTLTAWTIALPVGVQITAGNFRIWTRAVAGRAKSNEATNTSTWTGGNAATQLLAWRTDQGQYTATSGTQVARSGGTDGWDNTGVAPASVKIPAPKAGASGELARISIPNVPADEAAVCVGVAPSSATVKNRDNLACAMYADTSQYAFLRGGNLNGSKPYGGAGTGELELVILTTGVRMEDATGVVFSVDFNPFSQGDLKIYFIGYGNAGWLNQPLQKASQVTGASITCATLVPAF